MGQTLISKFSKHLLQLFNYLYLLNISYSTFKTNTSYYIYFEIDESGLTVQPSGMSTLQSPLIDGNIKQCFEFWYIYNNKLFFLNNKIIFNVVLLFKGII